MHAAPPANDERHAGGSLDADLDRAVDDLLLSVGLLLRRVRAETNRRGLTWSQTAVMSRLEKSGPLTVAELARLEGVKPQSMGATIGGLEHEGLVQRRPHPTDGRQMLVGLSAEGQAARRETGLAKRDWLRAGLADLRPDERRVLIEAAGLLRRLAS